MSTLTSASTDAAVQAAYDDNASYDEDASVAKAKAFITAARILLRRSYQSLSDGGSSMQQKIDLLKDEIAEAKQWLRDQGEYMDEADEATTFADVSGFRD